MQPSAAMSSASLQGATVVMLMMTLLHMEYVQGFFPSSSTLERQQHQQHSRSFATATASRRNAIVTMMTGWDDDEDVRFMSPKHIDTGFLKVSHTYSTIFIIDHDIRHPSSPTIEPPSALTSLCLSYTNLSILYIERKGSTIVGRCSTDDS